MRRPSPGDAAWGVCYNVFRPGRGIALNAMPDEEGSAHVKQAPDVVRAFAPINKKTGKPDKARAVSAYVQPHRSRSSGCVQLFCEKKDAVTEWNRRVQLELDKEDERHEAAVKRISSQYIDMEEGE